MLQGLSLVWEHKITLQRNAACILNSQPSNSLKESPHPLSMLGI